MPNHIHAILIVGTDNIRPYGKQINKYDCRTIETGGIKNAGFPVWQKSFHDHIIRDENDYKRIAEYIETNPQKWCNDCFTTPIMCR